MHHRGHLDPDEVALLVVSSISMTCFFSLSLVISLTSCSLCVSTMFLTRYRSYEKLVSAFCRFDFLFVFLSLVDKFEGIVGGSFVY